MPAKKRRAKTKTSKSRHKKAASKALRRAPKALAGKKAHRRAVVSRRPAGTSTSTVEVYEVVEAEVYQEPFVQTNDKEEDFGT